MGLFANYDIESIIAEGGMATVYKCTQSSLKRPVAVKVLSQQLMSKHPEIVNYFENESLIIARLSHPNIVHVIDRGISGGLPYFVMEYVDGMPLNVALKRRTLDFNKKLDITVQICKALAYAHKNGVIHRDIKPANVLIDTEGNVQVADFGIAQMVHVHPDEQGPIMGTPDYMSPEQKAGKNDVNAATDIYALGVIMYEMFTGKLPSDPVAFPSYFDPAIPAYLDEVITRCINPDPAKRFASAEEVKSVLLESMYGAHLKEPKKKEVLKGIGDIRTRFAVLDVVKETRFGSVYLCENTVNHNRLIIKKIDGTLNGYRENTVLSNLHHPNVVNIFGTSKEENVFIIVMEYLTGGSLNDQLVNPWPWKKAVKTAKEICQGLAFLHKNQLVHGNLRPSNVLFTGDGEAKIADCCLDEHYRGESTDANWYVYPNEPKNLLADMYSTGAILFEMLSGTVPSWKHGELAVNERFRTLPFDLQDIVRRMLAQVPKDRYRSFEAVITELDGLLNFDKRKHIRKKSQNLSSTFLFLVSILIFSALAALAFYFPDVIASFIGSIRKMLGRY